MPDGWRATRSATRSASISSKGRPLRDLVALGREHGFTPIVVYIPSAFTAYRHHVHLHDAGVERAVTEFSDRQRGFFARKAGEAGFVYRDLTSALQRAAAEPPSNRRLYFRTNVHLTPAGRAVVAAEVAEEIRKTHPPPQSAAK
jgi:SGNH hydrolase-like domain, acetyltransferase AlgX